MEVPGLLHLPSRRIGDTAWSKASQSSRDPARAAMISGVLRGQRGVSYRNRNPVSFGPLFKTDSNKTKHFNSNTKSSGVLLGFIQKTRTPKNRNRLLCDVPFTPTQHSPPTKKQRFVFLSISLTGYQPKQTVSHPTRLNLPFRQ